MKKAIVAFLTILLLGCKADTTSNVVPDTVEQKQTFEVYDMLTPLWARAGNFFAFADNESFEDMEKALESLKSLGIETVILPRLFAVDESGKVVDFTRVNPELGTFESLKSFCETVRQSRMHAILPFELRLISPDHVWRENNPQWFIDKAGLSQLNTDDRSLQNTLMETFKYWRRSVPIDGFSVRGSLLMSDTFWRQLRPSLESVGPVLMMADSDQYVKHHEHCFEFSAGTSFDRLVDQVINEEVKIDKLLSHHQTELEKSPATFAKYHHIDASTLDAADRVGIVLKSLLDGGPIYHDLALLEGNREFFMRINLLRNFNKSLSIGRHGGRMEVLQASDDIVLIRRREAGQTVALFVNCSSKPATFLPSKSLRTMNDLFSGKDIEIVADRPMELKPWAYFALANPSIQL